MDEHFLLQIDHGYIYHVTDVLYYGHGRFLLPVEEEVEIIGG